MGDKEWRNGCRTPTQDPSTNNRWLFGGAASKKHSQLLVLHLSALGKVDYVLRHAPRGMRLPLEHPTRQHSLNDSPSALLPPFPHLQGPLGRCLCVWAWGRGGAWGPLGASVSGPARGCAGRDFGRFTCLKLRGIVLAPPMAAPPITRWQARHTPGPRARRAPPYPLTFFWRETAVQRPHQCRTRAFMPKLRSISAPFRAHFA